jgi:hypothetical protein
MNGANEETSNAHDSDSSSKGLILKGGRRGRPTYLDKFVRLVEVKEMESDKLRSASFVRLAVTPSGLGPPETPCLSVGLPCPLRPVVGQ